MHPTINSAAVWSYHPYTPFLTDRGEILVTRIVPMENGFAVEWSPAEPIEIVYGERDGEMSCRTEAASGHAVITGLAAETDYQFQLQTTDGRKSLVRLIRTGDYLYTPIQYLHPADPAYAFSGRFLCSPTIVRQADGSLLASMDLFAGGGPQNLTLIYRSDDDGETWHWICDLFPCFWGKLFVHKGVTYMLSCSTEHGDILLGKSTDGGYHFSAPTVLFRGSCHVSAAGPDMSPEPPFIHDGRIWFNFHWGSWQIGKHHLCVASAEEDSDFLNPESWTITPPCIYDESWPGTAVGKSNGTLEGTFFRSTDGGLYILIRYGIGACVPDHGLAIVYRVQTENPALPPVFDRTIPFPGNHSKFTVLQDPLTGMHYSIISRIKDSANRFSRNLLSLIRSEDCLHWELVQDLIDFSDKDPQKYGFQYVDFFMEEENLYYVCRTAINQAENFHNSNVILFHKIEGFRNL